MRLQQIVLVVAASVGAVLAGGEASGAEVSPADRTLARALFDQGRAAAAEGKYAQACPKFEESQRLDPGLGTQFNLADCYEGAGKVASAWSLFLEVAAQAKKEGQAERDRVARGRAEALAGKLPRLLVAVSAADETPGMGVTLDGKALGRAVWGTPMPVDPGSHTVVASASGRKTWTGTVQVRLGGGTVETVAVPALEREAAAPPGAPVAAPAATGSSAPAPPAAPAAPAGQEAPRHWTTQRVAGAAVAGVGVVSAGVGLVLLSQAKSKHDEADPWCDGNACWDQGAVDLRADAARFQTLGYVTIGIGAAALAGGAVLYLAAPAPAQAGRGEPGRAAVRVGFGAQGAWIGGRW
jgi:serine/threonine-protein kinase